MTAHLGQALATIAVWGGVVAVAFIGDKAKKMEGSHLVGLAVVGLLATGAIWRAF